MITILELPLKQSIIVIYSDIIQVYDVGRNPMRIDEGDSVIYRLLDGGLLSIFKINIKTIRSIVDPDQSELCLSDARRPSHMESWLKCKRDIYRLV